MCNAVAGMLAAAYVAVYNTSSEVPAAVYIAESLKRSFECIIGAVARARRAYTLMQTSGCYSNLCRCRLNYMARYVVHYESAFKSTKQMHASHVRLRVMHLEALVGISAALYASHASVYTV